MCMLNNDFWKKWYALYLLEELYKQYIIEIILMIQTFYVKSSYNACVNGMFIFLLT